jgi:hypothetical protein
MPLCCSFCFQKWLNVALRHDTLLCDVMHKAKWALTIPTNGIHNPKT